MKECYTARVQRAIGISILILGGLVALLLAASGVPVERSSRVVKRSDGPILPPRKHTPPPATPRPPRGTWLALVYTGNGNGEVEPCG